AEVEDGERRTRYMRTLYPLGGNEYSLRRSRTLFGTRCRDPGWTIRFCLRAPNRRGSFGETFRSACNWEEEQVSATGKKIPGITGRLERINTSSGRQTLARKNTERKGFRRN